jgi:hypothetical protein
MVRKKLIIAVLATLCMTCALFMFASANSVPASKDTTTNVYVTNWPTAKAPYWEVLRLYAVRRPLWGPYPTDVYANSLTDSIDKFETTLVGSVQHTYDLEVGEVAVIFNESIVAERSFENAFALGGPVKIFSGYSTDGGEMVDHTLRLYLEIIHADGSRITIGGADYNTRGNIQTGYVFLSVSPGLIIAPGKRLAVGILDSAKNSAGAPISVTSNCYFCNYDAGEPVFRFYVEIPFKTIG